ncbi:hypothetical protein FQZ97_1127600 [compost metagenome]
MIGQDHAKAIGPGARKVDTVPGTAAVQKDQRFTLAGGVDNGFATIDQVNLAFEPGMVDSRIAEAVIGHCWLLGRLWGWHKSQPGEEKRHLSLDRACVRESVVDRSETSRAAEPDEKKPESLSRLRQTKELNRVRRR